MSLKSLVLVDGSYYLFRAYHAIKGLTNRNNEPTNAIYGVVNMLRKLLQDYTPDYFAVVFDAKGKSFRNDLYPDYKANRPPMPEDLACQIAPLHEIIRAMGIPLLMIDDVEADDVIGTLAKQAEQRGMITTISTGDKDLAQLVTANIRLINTMSNTLYDPAGVEAKFGVPPERIIDYLTLVGDSVDNIPGVAKVGPKTAIKWLSQYGSLDEILAHADEIKGKVGENLRASSDRIPLMRQLVTLKCDVDINVTPEDLVQSSPDQNLLKARYQQWDFRTWLADLNGNPVPADELLTDTPAVTSAQKYEAILEQKELDRWIKKLLSADIISLDTETTSLDYMDAEIVGLSFAIASDVAAYVPLNHDYTGAPEQLSCKSVLEQLKPLLEDEDRTKLGQNLKYDMNVLANYNIRLAGIQHDTMLQSYILDSTATRHDLDSLAQKYLNVTTIHYEDVAGKGAKQIPFNQVTIEQAAPYAAEDADIAFKLHQILWPKLEKNKNLQALYENMEIPLLPVLSRMERNGVEIDADMLRRQSFTLTERMAEIEQKAHDLAGENFNIASPKQIQTILFEKMDLPILAKTPKGQPSTAESVLQDLAHDYELPRYILEFRGLSKLRSTYTEKLPQQINQRTGRVHTSYHQAVAATGRLSSSDPNLQNIPIKTAEGRRIRQAFIAPAGYKLLAADYSQIELRIMAHLSGDGVLLQAFANGEDIHKTTAAEVFATTLDSVNDEQRRAAKAINFGLIYGMSPFGLAKQLGINHSEARDYVDRYFKRYPEIKIYMEKTRFEAKENGYVETLFKRRLYLPEINSRNAARRQYAERTAINAPMQGTAADIIKRAMISVDKWLCTSPINARMIMQVHDELVFEVPDDRVDEAGNAITKHMITAANLDIPLEVVINSGSNWDEAH
jgi:DNA polymerase-1